MATSSSGSSGRPRLSASPAQSAATGKKPRATPAKPSSAQPTPATSQAGASTADSAKAEGKRRRIDWEAVERDYRTGKFTLRELEAKHRAGYAKISARAKREGWTKDLADVVRQATKAALIAEVATARATEGQSEATSVVLAAAELNKQVILQHRAELRAARQIAMDLLAEVQSQRLLAADNELLAQVLAGEADDIKQIAEAQRVVHKALATGSRVSSIKALAETLTKLHLGERTAFSLDESTDAPPPPPDLSSISPERRQEAYLAYVTGQR
jgi:hypothetical protein